MEQTQKNFTSEIAGKVREINKKLIPKRRELKRLETDNPAVATSADDHGPGDSHYKIWQQMAALRAEIRGYEDELKKL